MSDRDYLLVALGAALYIILMHHSRTLRTLNTNTMRRLEDIEGIDLNALNIARQRGLI